MADINKIKINGTEYNISPEWASTGTNTIAIGTSSTTGISLGTVASFTSSSSTIKSDYIQLKDIGSTYPVLTLGSDTNSVSINGGLIVRGGDVNLSGGTVTAGYVVSDSATINNGFEVKGDTTISGTLGVTGLTTLGTVTANGITGGTATINGATTINSDLKVTGSSTVSNNITAYSLKLNSNATVNGDINLGSYSENIISSSNKLTLRGSANGGVEISNNYGIIKSTSNGIQLGTGSAPGLVLGSKNDVTLGNDNSTTTISGYDITLGDYIKLSSGYVNTNAPLYCTNASFSGTVDITGALTAKSSLNVTSAATFSNTATVSGALKANSTFTSTGAATFNSTVTANGAVTANKGLTAKTSFASPKISDNGSTVTISATTIDVNNGENGSFDIEGGLTIGSKLNVNGVIQYNPSGGYIVIGSGSTNTGATCPVYIGTTSNTVSIGKGYANITANSSSGTIDIGNSTININNGSVQVKGGDVSIGTLYPIVVGDSQILIGTNNGTTPTFINLNFTGDGSIKLGTGSNTIGVGWCGNGGTDTLVVKDTVTANGALTAKSTLSVAKTSTFTGAVTANGGLTANTSFASPNISDSSGKFYVGGDSPNIQRIRDSNGYYMSMGTVSRSDPKDYNIAMGVYTTANQTIGTTMMKAGNYRIVCDSDNGVYIGTYTGSWNNVLSVYGPNLTIGNSSYGSTTVYGPFAVSNALNAKSTLNVTGAATFSNTATVSGALKANSTLDVAGASTFTGAVTAKSDINCYGNASIIGNITIGSSSGGGSIGAANTWLKLSGDKGVTIGDNYGYINSTSSGVTIGTSSGINLNCAQKSTTLGYKIGSGTETSTTCIDGDYIHIGHYGGEYIRIGTIDSSNYTAIFGTTSICETGGNLTIGTTGYTTSIRGNLSLSSATISNITLGTTTLGTTTVNKPLTASSTLNVSGVSNLSGIVNAKSTLNVTSTATFNGLTYTKKTLYAESALSVSGTTTLGGTVTANAVVKANKGLTASTSFTSPHITDTSTAITINGITITNNLSSNTITLTNANGYSITLPLTANGDGTSSSSSTGSGT